MPCYTESIYCDDNVEKSIEHACKALYILQGMIEYEEIAKKLKERLIEMFSDIPIKEGKKQYKNYHYYSNGVCYAKSTSGNKYCEILLEPYEIEEDEKEYKVKINYEFVKHHNYMWWYQVKNYIGKPVKLSRDSYNPVKINILEAYEKYQNYIALTDEEKELVNKDELFEALSKNIMNQLRVMNSDIFTGTMQITFLTEKGIEEIIKFYESFEKDSKDFHWEEQKTIRKFLEAMENSTEVIKIDTAMKDICTIQKGSWSNIYTIDVDKFFNEYYSNFIELAEEYEHIKEILGKINVLPKIKKSKKKTEGEQNGKESKSRNSGNKQGSGGSSEIIDATYETI